MPLKKLREGYIVNKEFDAFLRQVEKYLKPLPSSERTDIIKEINSQILELKNSGKTTEEIFNRLGSPKQLAEVFLSDYITEKSFLSSKVFLALCAYYTLVGFTGVVIIPTLAICAPVFIFCSAITPILAFIKMVNYLFHLGLPYMEGISSIGTFQMNPVLDFLVSLPIAGLLFGLGWGCWKLLIAYIEGVGRVRQNIISKDKS